MPIQSKPSADVLDSNLGAGPLLSVPIPPTDIEPTAIAPQGTATPVWMALPKIETPPENRRTTQVVNPKDIERIRRNLPKFRILVIGRANSGKTTLIKKMCDTNEDPIIYVIEGGKRKRLDASVLNPSAMRGEHDIYAEITFDSKPNLIFHDSRGFEAGSVDEVEKVRQFIEEMSKKEKLSDRLHVIWFCLPVDYTRVASPAELSFFSESTKDVPVVLIFTKWDGQIIRTCGNLCEEQGMEFDEAMEAAPEEAKKVLEKHFVPVFKNTPHPPSSYTLLGYMDEPDTKCSELVEKTADALNDNALRRLFVSVQTHNLHTCMKYGIRFALEQELYTWASSWIVIQKHAIYWVTFFFGHLDPENNDYSNNDRVNKFDAEFKRRTPWFWLLRPVLFVLDLMPRSELEKDDGSLAAFHLFDHVITASQHIFNSPLLRALSNISCAAITATRSFEIMKRTQSDIKTALKASIEEYLASPQCNAVHQAIKTQFGLYAFKPYISNRSMSKISEELYTICLENLLKD